MTGGHAVGGDVPAPRSRATVGGARRAPRGELAVCCLVAALSLAVAAAVHRFAPGFGIVFKPLLWPLLVLPFTVRPRYALVTSAVVPLLSCAVTGMPTLPVALTLSACATVFMSAFMVFVRMVGGALWVPRMFRMARSAEDVRPYHAVGGDVPAPRNRTGNI